MYNKGASNNFGVGGFNQPNNQNWGNPGQQVGFGNNQGGWPQTGNNAWGGNNNWNNKAGWNGNQPASTGGMSGIMGGGGGNTTAVIASGQRLVGKQKQTIG